ncbi:proteasome beta subunit [Cardiosporidium cionae]|uniref:Proteasome subunit beta n=1 Tax=Cardiosporidium cionae TaxID=476202 RepID=A0ABQ7J5L7_9APIC|nr:proteasome beta subunit [Cardiosporidium cionae]|eukprot:KAF8819301.1 proteasome beta subunit [Cardiosporidium cionae]
MRRKYEASTCAEGLMGYNGSAMVAMTGKNCVAIATDSRLGIRSFSTVAENFQKVFKMNDRCFVGFSGLATDVQTMHQLLRFRMNLYSLKEQHNMQASVVVNLIGNMLYQHRFSPYLVSPMLAGLNDDGEPIISTYDFIGAKSSANDFVVGGSAAETLYGVCEALYKPDMEPEQLFETTSQCFLAGLDRTITAGWGAVIYIITEDGTLCRNIVSRMD